MTNPNGRLRIQFVGLDDFYIDNVSLVPVSVAAASVGSGVASSALRQTQQPERVFLQVAANACEGKMTEFQPLFLMIQ